MKLKMICLCLILGMIACEKEEPIVETCETTGITYSNGAASILNASCAVSGCHVDGNEGVALFSLVGYAQAKAVVDFGRIVGTINHSTGFSPMPKGGDKLSDCDIDKITAWIADGAPE